MVRGNIQLVCRTTHSHWEWASSCVAGAWPTDLSEKEDGENCNQNQVVPSSSEVAVVCGQRDAAMTFFLCRGSIQGLLYKQSTLSEGWGWSKVGGASTGGGAETCTSKDYCCFVVTIVES